MLSVLHEWTQEFDMSVNIYKTKVVQKRPQYTLYKSSIHIGWWGGTGGGQVLLSRPGTDSIYGSQYNCQICDIGCSESTRHIGCQSKSQGGLRVRGLHKTLWFPSSAHSWLWGCHLGPYVFLLHPDSAK